MADDALVGLVSVLLPVRVLDAEALREAEVAQAIHRRLIDERVDISDAGVLGLVAERLCGPLRRSVLRPFRLSVAKVASAALGGSSGVSSAITRIPALRARSIVGTIALVSLGVIRIALAPAFISARWRPPGPCCRHRICRRSCESRPRAPSPSPAAPSFIFAKNGLVFVFVISPTMILSSAKAEADASAHAATAQAAIVFQRAPRRYQRSSSYLPPCDASPLLLASRATTISLMRLCPGSGAGKREFDCRGPLCSRVNWAERVAPGALG